MSVAGFIIQLGHKIESKWRQVTLVYDSLSKVRSWHKATIIQRLFIGYF
jgi:hypothetical protein